MNIFCSVSLNEIQKDFLKKKIDDKFFFLGGFNGKVI